MLHRYSVLTKLFLTLIGMLSLLLTAGFVVVSSGMALGWTLLWCVMAFALAAIIGYLLIRRITEPLYLMIGTLDSRSDFLSLSIPQVEQRRDEWGELYQHLHARLMLWKNLRTNMDERLHIMAKPLTDGDHAIRMQHDAMAEVQHALAEQITRYDTNLRSSVTAAKTYQELRIKLSDMAETQKKIMRQAHTVYQQLSSSREQQSSRIERLGQLIKKFDDVSDVVRRVHFINDQTKLIAFNAAIEASSNGEHGRRFAIIASDIRNLSQTIDDSNIDMKNILSDLQTALSSLIESARADSHRVMESVQTLNEAVIWMERNQNEMNDALETAATISKMFSDNHAAVMAHTENIKRIQHSIQTTNAVFNSLKNHIHDLKAGYQSIGSLS